MTDEQPSPLADLWTDAPPLRRNARGGAPTGLPAAAPVPRAAASAPLVDRARLITGFAIVVALGLAGGTTTALTHGSGDSDAGVVADAPVRSAGAASFGGEGGGAAPGPFDDDRTHGAQPQTDRQPDAEREDPQEDPPQDPRHDDALQDHPQAPDKHPADDPSTDDPGIAGPTAPAPTPEGPTPPPSEPTTPPQPAPQPPPPAPQPPTPPKPSEPPPPQPEPQPQPQPLRFTGLVEHHTISLLGIKLLSSYTLSLSGEPGATASVTYGSVHAGSVRFSGAGHASLTLGGSLIDLGLHNPIIRAEYSDGTAGAAIEVRRNAI
ncbi:hypothetical protein [Microbacterium soli]|uniref:Uncharacterized protein n=1 Tax=Microbacterium soli TaxID=446075 RepID=A0ABP7N195_9MICO